MCVNICACVHVYYLYVNVCKYMFVWDHLKVSCLEIFAKSAILNILCTSVLAKYFVQFNRTSELYNRSIRFVLKLQALFFVSAMW